MADTPESNIDRLVAQTRSPDNDLKVDALAKLQAEFETGVELQETDNVLNALKACLRTPNQHVSTAALSAITSFVPLIVHGSTAPSSNASSSSQTGEAATLRQVVNAFLSAGGVLDRLGDNRDKSREKAREALVSIASVVHKHGGQPVPAAHAARLQKPLETPMSLFERFVKEVAFTSKTWRVREQIIMSFVSIRQACPSFPLRPYVQPFVETLEDPDGTVRDCARQAVIQIFTGPTVTDAARADLKKEMVRKGVRKGIQEVVLNRLLASTSSTTAAARTVTPNSERAPSEHGGSTTGGILSRQPNNVESAPPAFEPSRSRVGERPSSRAATALAASTSAEPPTPSSTDDSVKPVFIASARDVEREIAEMLPHFEGKESEHNWADRDRAIRKLRGMIKGGIQNRYPDAFLAGLKSGMLDKSFKALLSLRTTVSTNAISLYTELTIAFGTALDPFLEVLLNTLLGMSGYTKKIVAQGTQGVVAVIMENTTCPPKLVVPMLAIWAEDKTVQARQFAAGHILKYLEVHGHRYKQQLEHAGGRETLEKCIKRGLGDANAGVRENARATFWAFNHMWPDRGSVIMNALDAGGRKQLEKACPDNDMLKSVSSVISTADKPKKTSAAAMIAAARAKQQQIAAAPPTLRHHATSTAHAARAASPPLRSPSRTGAYAGPAANMTASTSRGRMSPTPPSPSHLRTRSGSSGSLPTPPSPPPSPTSAKTARRPTVSTTTPTTPPRASGIRPPSQTAKTAPSLNASTMRAPTTPTHAASHSLSIPHTSTPPRPSADDEMLTNPALLDGGDDSSDASDERPHDVISFSTPYERYGTPLTPVQSVATTGPPNGTSRTHEHDTFASPPPPSAQLPEHVVEDALRARADQAVSAADRLLELVVDEDDTLHISPIPESLLTSNGPAVRPAPVLKSLSSPTTTSAQRASVPTTNGSPPAKSRTPKRDTGWWQLRMSTFEVGQQEQPDAPDPVLQLRNIITKFAQDAIDVASLQHLAALCSRHPVDEDSPSVEQLSPSSPSVAVGSQLSGDIWLNGKMFDKVFEALVQFLASGTMRETELLELGLVVLWEMLDNQTPYINGLESSILSLLFQLRYSNRRQVMEGTTEIRDLLAIHVDPVFGLTMANGCLKAFLAQPLPKTASADMKPSILAFGLLALAKFIEKLPCEVIEEELPRLKSILISSLNDGSLVVREAATVAIIAAQLVLRDETHLFMLLDGLANDKKNLLTYFFDKHGARGSIEGVAASTGGQARLEKEMRRLDTRMNTPKA